MESKLPSPETVNTPLESHIQETYPNESPHPTAGTTKRSKTEQSALAATVLYSIATNTDLGRDRFKKRSKKRNMHRTMSCESEVTEISYSAVRSRRSTRIRLVSDEPKKSRCFHHWFFDWLCAPPAPKHRDSDLRMTRASSSMFFEQLYKEQLRSKEAELERLRSTLDRMQHENMRLKKENNVKTAYISLHTKFPTQSDIARFNQKLTALERCTNSKNEFSHDVDGRPNGYSSGENGKRSPRNSKSRRSQDISSRSGSVTRTVSCQESISVKEEWSKEPSQLR